MKQKKKTGVSPLGFSEVISLLAGCIAISIIALDDLLKNGPKLGKRRSELYVGYLARLHWLQRYFRRIAALA